MSHDAYLRPGERAVAGFDMGTKHYTVVIIAYTPPVLVPKAKKARAPKGKKRTAAEAFAEAPPPPEPVGAPEHVRWLSARMIDLELDRVVASYDAGAPGGTATATVVPKRALPPSVTVGGKKPAHTVDIYTSLGRHLAEWDALLDTRAACYIECQRADQKTGNGPLMATVSKATISAIAAADAAAGFGRRPVIAMAAGKEGLKRASSKTPGVSYDARKAHSGSLGRGAMAHYGDVDAMRFMAMVDAGGWKDDDFYDASGIARRKARENHQ